MRLNFIFWFLALTEANIIREEGKKLTENLMDFPFRLLDGSHQQQDNSLASRLEGGGVEVVGDEEKEQVVREEDEEDDEALVVSVLAEAEEDVRCVEKVMMVEETEWDEVVNCEVSQEERCHQSYVTR